MVVDASALLELLLGTRTGRRIGGLLAAPGQTLHAPQLIDLEVAQALRRYVVAHTISAARGLEALEDLRDFPLQRFPHTPFLGRIWDLRHNLTAYDAAYVALAEALDVSLLTCDRALASSPGHRARMELV